MAPAHLGRVSYPAWRRLPRARPAARQTRAWRQAGDDAPASPRTAIEADPLLFAEQDTGALVVGEDGDHAGVPDVSANTADWPVVATANTTARRRGVGAPGVRSRDPDEPIADGGSGARRVGTPVVASPTYSGRGPPENTRNNPPGRVARSGNGADSGSRGRSAVRCYTPRAHPRLCVIPRKNPCEGIRSGTRRPTS